VSELLEGSASQSITIDPDKYLKATVTQLTFNETYKACRSQSTIDGHHWPAGKPDGYKKSKKAAVLQLGKNKTCTAKITVKIDSKGLSGKGIITGTLDNLLFSGEVPLANGVHENIKVTLKDNPETLSWVRGTMLWEIDAKDIAAIAGKTRVEMFFVFADPAKMKFFEKKGVWIEALRFIFKKGKLKATKKISDGIAKVTECCFKLPFHEYEIKHGSSAFGGHKGYFTLGDYMVPDNGTVNCYDQTYAVIVFGGALGVTVKGLFLEPFGYLKLTKLVGRGDCNNPFPNKKYEDARADFFIDLNEKIVGMESMPVNTDFLSIDPKDQHRSAFGNHMFCEYKSKIYDACAGASKGEFDRAGYLLEAIDTTIPDFKKYDFPSTKEEIVQNSKTKISSISEIPKEINGRSYKIDAQIVEVYNEEYSGKKLHFTMVEVGSVK